MNRVMEEARSIPIACECDLCVVGGSSTGVFAAIRAARLGLDVVIIEKNNCFGGTATSGLVNVWHSMFDFDRKERIVGGLSQEIVERLTARGEAETVPEGPPATRMNPLALSRELDRAVCDAKKITVLFHTYYSGIILEGDAIQYVLIQNKDGRSAIKAAFCIDATGDGDVLRDAQVERYQHEHIQPPTSCFLMTGETTDEQLGRLVSQHGKEFGLSDDWGWYEKIPGMEHVYLRADQHVTRADVCHARGLSEGEMEGRRNAFAIQDLLRKYASRDYTIVNLCGMLGIRDSYHYKTRFYATGTDLLMGRRYEDAILQGSYRVDIHHEGDNGITFKELNGEASTFYGKGTKEVRWNWREEAGLDDRYARCYQLPFSALVQDKISNLLLAGRMIHADEAAYGALRVMICCNQMGEAAGTAAYLALHHQQNVLEIDGTEVRKELRKGGSAL